MTAAGFPLKEITMATLNIRVSDQLRDLVSEASEQRGLSTSDFVRRALELSTNFPGPSEDRPAETGPPTLSPVDRKTLIMLHRILLATHGELQSSRYLKEDEVRSLQALESGFVGEYSTEFADCVDEVVIEECELVWDILDMFRVIKYSVRELGPDGWTEIGVRDAEVHGSFRGFDLNDSMEARLLSYTTYLVENGRWVEQQAALSSANDNGNSHFRMLPTYQKLLARFKPLYREIIRNGRGLYLSADPLRSILLEAPGSSLTGTTGG